MSSSAPWGEPCTKALVESLGDGDAELEEVGAAKAGHLRERCDAAARDRQRLGLAAKVNSCSHSGFAGSAIGSSPGASSTDGCGSGALTRPALASSALAAGSSTATTNSPPQR